MSIYDAAVRYREAGVPLVVIAGKEYGSGSSRDWAAKGTRLLGVRAVIAESYERIHRSNLLGMGVLPLEFKNGDNRGSLGLTGHEVFEIEGVSALAPKKSITVHAKPEDGKVKTFSVVARADTPKKSPTIITAASCNTFCGKCCSRHPALSSANPRLFSSRGASAEV